MDISYITIYAIYEYTTCIQILMLHEFPCHPAAGEGLPMPSRSAQIALAALHVKKLPKQQEPPLCPEEKLQLQKNKLILIRPHYTHTVYESKLVDLWRNIISLGRYHEESTKTWIVFQTVSSDPRLTKLNKSQKYRHLSRLAATIDTHP